MKPFKFDQINYAIDYNREHPVHFVLEADIPETLHLTLMVIDPKKKYPDNIITTTSDKKFWDIVPDVGSTAGLRKYNDNGELIEYSMLLDVQSIFEKINQEYRMVNHQLTIYDIEEDKPLYTQQGGYIVFLPNGVKPPGIE